MQPLSVAVEQARQKLKLTGSASILKLGSKTLDLSLPARFANIPAGSKLDLDTGMQACSSDWETCKIVTSTALSITSGIYPI